MVCYNEWVNHFIQSTDEAWQTNENLNNQFSRKKTKENIIQTHTYTHTLTLIKRNKLSDATKATKIPFLTLQIGKHLNVNNNV